MHSGPGRATLLASLTGETRPDQKGHICIGTFSSCITCGKDEGIEYKKDVIVKDVRGDRIKSKIQSFEHAS